MELPDQRAQEGGDDGAGEEGDEPLAKGAAPPRKRQRASSSAPAPAAEDDALDRDADLTSPRPKKKVKRTNTPLIAVLRRKLDAPPFLSH